MHNFNNAPNLKYKRSRIHMPQTVKTSMTVGKLYPLNIVEVLPGDTFKGDLTCVARSATSFLKVPMDNLYMDTYAFFVPARILYKDFEKVFGDPSPSAWTKSIDSLAKCPTTTSVSSVVSGSVADYLGLPLGNIPKGVSILPFRAFAKIYNEWFRNENIVDEVYVQSGNITSSEAINGRAWAANNYTGMLPSVGKSKDFFTSCLPSPQKGLASTIPLSNLYAPVGPINGTVQPIDTEATLKFRTYAGDLQFNDKYNLTLVPDASSVGEYDYFKVDASNPTTPGVADVSVMQPANLVAALNTVGINVSDFRFAIQVQKMLEKDARYGTRYREYLLGHYGVSNNDGRLQVPEFLAGSRMPINIQQVQQTNTQEYDAQGTVQSPLASLGAYSLSGSTKETKFTKSFTEFGYIITVGCIRQVHTYSQGIDKLWFRQEKLDYYDPTFANISEQPIYTTQIYANGFTDLKQQVFGYNEAWAEYRYLPNKITGALRPAANNGLDVWHFGDDFAAAPTLSPDFILEKSTFVDRALAADSTVVDNFLVDLFFDYSAVRVMPLYSIPGFVDHN